MDHQDNALAIYLAEYGVDHRASIVCIKKPFGRVHELWNLAMGLGLVEVLGSQKKGHAHRSWNQNLSHK